MSKSNVKMKNYFDITDHQKVFIPIKENSKKTILKIDFIILCSIIKLG